MNSVIKIDSEELVNALPNLSLQDQENEMKNKGAVDEEGCQSHSGTCAICLDKIVQQETALVKGCEHAYCLTCILQWATYSKMPTCPQCRLPFESLNVHRSIDGRIYDYMFEESVCLLLRATWFKPEEQEEVYDDLDDYFIFERYLQDDYYYRLFRFEDEDDEEDEIYYTSLPSPYVGNWR